MNMAYMHILPAPGGEARKIRNPRSAMAIYTWLLSSAVFKFLARHSSAYLKSQYSRGYGSRTGTSSRPA